ncbi:MAG: hypothetical protein WCW56_02435 [Candidatus Paceibacterota bacterium]|jgi:hypothetical protein
MPSSAEEISHTTFLSRRETLDVCRRQLANISLLRGQLDEGEARVRSNMEGLLADSVIDDQTLSLFGETVAAIGHQPEKRETRPAASTQKPEPARKSTPTNGNGRVKEGSTASKIQSFLSQRSSACYEEIQNWAEKTGVSDNSKQGKGRIYATLFFMKKKGMLKSELGPNPKGGKGRKGQVLYYSIATTGHNNQGGNGNGQKAKVPKTSPGRREADEEDELTKGGTSLPKLREVTDKSQFFEIVRKVLESRKDEPKSSMTFEDLQTHVKDEAGRYGYDLSYTANSFFQNGVAHALEKLQGDGLVTKGERFKWRTPINLPNSQKPPLPPPRKFYTDDDLEEVIVALVNERPDELSSDDIVPTLMRDGTIEWRHDPRISASRLKTQVEEALERLLRSEDLFEDEGVLVAREKIAC